MDIVIIAHATIMLQSLRPLRLPGDGKKVILVQSCVKNSTIFRERISKENIKKKNLKKDFFKYEMFDLFAESRRRL